MHEILTQLLAIPNYKVVGIEMTDNILLNQLGVLDAGVKNGFNFDASNFVIDVSLNG